MLKKILPSSNASITVLAEDSCDPISLAQASHKFAAVMETAAMSEAEIAQYCGAQNF